MTTTDLTSITVASAQELYRMTDADVKAQVEAIVKSALDEARMRRQARTMAEIAEPEGWWDLYAIGPIQFTGIPDPLLPHQVIKVGEKAYVITVLVLNDFLILSPGTTAADVLSNFALPYEVRYQTGNLTTWSLGQTDMNVVHSGAGFNLVPQVNFYVDVLEITASRAGLCEMNISARILGATSPFANAPQFAGYARAVLDLDADLFASPTPGFQFDLPIRFQIYE
jgi:hypothetical protein